MHAAQDKFLAVGMAKWICPTLIWLALLHFSRDETDLHKPGYIYIYIYIYLYIPSPNISLLLLSPSSLHRCHSIKNGKIPMLRLYLPHPTPFEVSLPLPRRKEWGWSIHNLALPDHLKKKKNTYLMVVSHPSDLYCHWILNLHKLIDGMWKLELHSDWFLELYEE
jgi:hypothetical protein